MFIFCHCKSDKTTTQASAIRLSARQSGHWWRSMVTDKMPTKVGLNGVLETRTGAHGAIFWVWGSVTPEMSLKVTRSRSQGQPWCFWFQNNFPDVFFLRKHFCGERNKSIRKWSHDYLIATCVPFFFFADLIFLSWLKTWTKLQIKRRVLSSLAHLHFLSICACQTRVPLFCSGPFHRKQFATAGVLFRPIPLLTNKWFSFEKSFTPSLAACPHHKAKRGQLRSHNLKILEGSEESRRFLAQFMKSTWFWFTPSEDTILPLGYSLRNELLCLWATSVQRGRRCEWCLKVSGVVLVHLFHSVHESPHITETTAAEDRTDQNVLIGLPFSNGGKNFKQNSLRCWFWLTQTVSLPGGTVFQYNVADAGLSITCWAAPSLGCSQACVELTRELGCASFVMDAPVHHLSTSTGCFLYNSTLTLEIKTAVWSLCREHWVFAKNDRLDRMYKETNKRCRSVPLPPGVPRFGRAFICFSVLRAQPPCGRIWGGGEENYVFCCLLVCFVFLFFFAVKYERILTWKWRWRPSGCGILLP